MKNNYIMMKLTIKLLPPYTKSGRPEDHSLQLEAQSIKLEDLVRLINKKWQDILEYSLINDQKLVNAEFAVNNKLVKLEDKVKDGDQITILPYVGGG